MTEATTVTKKPLKLTCTTADCGNGFHAFRPSRDMRGTTSEGACRECREHLIPWDRVRARDIEDIEFTFLSLQVELIRHHFWHLKIPEKAQAYAKNKGMDGLRDRVPKQIRSSVGKANPFRDGAQTPRETSKNVNPVHLAQHATASCCRKCIEDWHGIPTGRALSATEVDYLSALAIRFLELRLPDLPDEGLKKRGARRG